MYTPLTDPDVMLSRQLYTRGLMTSAEKKDLEERSNAMAARAALFAARQVVSHQIGFLDHLVRGWNWLRAL